MPQVRARLRSRRARALSLNRTYREHIRSATSISRSTPPLAETGTASGSLAVIIRSREEGHAPIGLAHLTRPIAIIWSAAGWSSVPGQPRPSTTNPSAASLSRFLRACRLRSCMTGSPRCYWKFRRPCPAPVIAVRCGGLPGLARSRRFRRPAPRAARSPDVVGCEQSHPRRGDIDGEKAVLFAFRLERMTLNVEADLEAGGGEEGIRTPDRLRLCRLFGMPFVLVGK
jgi:hypothetical protein